MLAKRIIPCLDVKQGRVVKGINFVELRDAGDPVESAARYDQEGADELTFLDITASHEQRSIILDVVAKTAEQVFIPLTVGGGVAAEEDIRKLLKAGADKVSINTAAVFDPDFVAAAARRFGSQCTVVAVDARACTGDEGSAELPAWAGSYPALLLDGEHSGWQVYTHGGRIPTGIDALAWTAHMAEVGAGEILLTSMDRDGTRSGYDIKLTRAVSDAVPVPVVASGGVGGPEHLLEGLTAGGAEAALAASIFHYGDYSIAECKDFLAEGGVEVRRPVL